MPEFGVRPDGHKRYGHLLRPIGAHLDTLSARYITIAEVEDGFVWQCFKLDDPAHAMSGTIEFKQIPALVESIKAMKQARQSELLEQEQRAAAARRLRLNPFHRREAVAEPVVDEKTLHPICPLGYEETLRSVGNKLEDQRARTIMIVEREATMLVRYALPLPGYIRLDVSKQEMFSGLHENDYSPDDLQVIVEDSRRRRGVKYYQT